MASLVMALVLSTAVTTLQRAFISLQNARDLNIASQMLQSEMQKMRLADWTTVNAFPAAATPVTLDTAFTSNPFVGSRFTLARSVADPKTDPRIITLRVAWLGAPTGRFSATSPCATRATGSMITSTARRNHRAAGLTLVELMFASGLGS